MGSLACVRAPRLPGFPGDLLARLPSSLHCVQQVWGPVPGPRVRPFVLLSAALVGPTPAPLHCPKSPVCDFGSKVGHRGAGSLSPAGVTRTASLLQVRGRRGVGPGAARAGRCYVPAFAADSEQTTRGPFKPSLFAAGSGRRSWEPGLVAPPPVDSVGPRGINCRSLVDRTCRAGWTTRTNTALSWCPSALESSTCQRTSPPSWPGRCGGCPRR